MFEIIADARWIQKNAGNNDAVERAARIELQADSIVKTILGTADLTTLDLPDEVIAQICELLRIRRV